MLTEVVQATPAPEGTGSVRMQTVTSAPVLTPHGAAWGRLMQWQHRMPRVSVPSLPAPALGRTRPWAAPTLC